MQAVDLAHGLADLFVDVDPAGDRGLLGGLQLAVHDPQFRDGLLVARLLEFPVQILDSLLAILEALHGGSMEAMPALA